MMTSNYLIQMIRRLPPAGSPVVPGSTPVVAFGDPSQAEVATLGINPSSAEFVGDVFLTGANRRLATLDSLSAERLDRLTDEQVRTVIDDCAAYFNCRPYRRWFDPLDQLLRQGAGVSYYDGGACHLDLVQWATSPVWGRIKDPRIRQALLDEGVPYLRVQLANENVRLVLLNGRAVIDQVVKVGLAELEDAGRIALKRNDCRLFAGAGEGVRWLGWSTNLQSSFGVTAQFKQELASWLKKASAGEREAEGATMTDDLQLSAGGYLPQGIRVSGKTALFDLLKRWLSESRASTIGDGGTYGGKPWVYVEVGSMEVHLNADTKRAAVEAFVTESAQDPERDWLVIANRNQKINKVLPGPGPEPTSGWFAYLDKELAGPGAI